MIEWKQYGNNHRAVSKHFTFMVSANSYHVEYYILTVHLGNQVIHTERFADSLSACKSCRQFLKSLRTELFAELDYLICDEIADISADLEK